MLIGELSIQELYHRKQIINKWHCKIISHVRLRVDFFHTCFLSVVILFISLINDHLNAQNYICVYVIAIPMSEHHHKMTGNTHCRITSEDWIYEIYFIFELKFFNTHNINKNNTFLFSNLQTRSIVHLNFPPHHVNVSSFEGLHVKAADMAISIYMCLIYFRVSTKTEHHIHMNIGKY